MESTSYVGGEPCRDVDGPVEGGAGGPALPADLPRHVVDDARAREGVGQLAMLRALARVTVVVHLAPGDVVAVRPGHHAPRQEDAVRVAPSLPLGGGRRCDTTAACKPEGRHEPDE